MAMTLTGSKYNTAQLHTSKSHLSEKPKMVVIVDTDGTINACNAAERHSARSHNATPSNTGVGTTRDDFFARSMFSQLCREICESPDILEQLGPDKKKLVQQIGLKENRWSSNINGDTISGTTSKEHGDFVKLANSGDDGKAQIDMLKDLFNTYSTLSDTDKEKGLDGFDALVTRDAQGTLSSDALNAYNQDFDLNSDAGVAAFIGKMIKDFGTPATPVQFVSFSNQTVENARSSMKLIADNLPDTSKPLFTENAFALGPNITDISEDMNSTLLEAAEKKAEEDKVKAIKKGKTPKEWNGKSRTRGVGTFGRVHDPETGVKGSEVYCQDLAKEKEGWRMICEKAGIDADTTVVVVGDENSKDGTLAQKIYDNIGADVTYIKVSANVEELRSGKSFEPTLSIEDFSS